MHLLMMNIGFTDEKVITIFTLGVALAASLFCLPGLAVYKDALMSPTFFFVGFSSFVSVEPPGDTTVSLTLSMDTARHPAHVLLHRVQSCGMAGQINLGAIYPLMH